MVDPTSDLGEDVDEADAPACRACDESIVDEPSHRVVTWVTDDAVETAHFCSEACRGEWSRPSP